jgi:hypothetical protein
MTSYGLSIQQDMIKSDFTADTAVSDSVSALEARIVTLEGIVSQLVSLINVLQKPGHSESG